MQFLTRNPGFTILVQAAGIVGLVMGLASCGKGSPYTKNRDRNEHFSKG